MSDVERITYLADIPRIQAKARGGASAISFDGAVTTFAQLDRQSDQVAAALAAAGVGPGARVAVLAKNH